MPSLREVPFFRFFFPAKKTFKQQNPHLSTQVSILYLLLYFRSMKMQIAAICFNERELELYISQLRSQGFESLSDVKKAEDGSYYLTMTKGSKFEMPVPEKTALQPEVALSA